MQNSVPGVANMIDGSMAADEVMGENAGARHSKMERYRIWPTEDQRDAVLWRPKVRTRSMISRMS